MPTVDSSPLNPRIEASLHETYDSLARTNGLLDPSKLADYEALFRSRFGPEMLRSLDGEALLNTMHAHGVKDSLVVWLEFKDDDEFRGGELGGIGGGAAHKFNLFKRQGTNQWVTGSPQNARDISQAEAIEVARRHRDQLLAAVDLLRSFAPPFEDASAAYIYLQRELAARAPDLYNKGWAHKYLSLLFPDRIDDYHNTDWQNHHLIRLLIAPSEEEEGLYVNAHHYVRLAAEFGWPMNHLTRVLNVRSGPPVKYWRIGTTLGDDGSIWDDMHRDGYVAVGWEAIGDLSGPVEDAARREQITPLINEIKPRLADHYSQWMTSGVITRKAGEIARFAVGIAPDDIVLAVKGFGALGVGRIAGPYQYTPNVAPEGAPHRRAVEWLATEPFELPWPEEGKLTTVKQLYWSGNLIEIERQRLNGRFAPVPPPREPALESAVVSADVVEKVDRVPLHKARLKGVPGRVQAILERKGQVILYGPPGTGKTYWANRSALDISALEAFGRPIDELPSGEQDKVRGTPLMPGLVRSCTFHPAYGYEDFLEGYRPQQGTGGQLVFELRDGIFRQICREASAAPDRRFILLIDEINRGDIPRIFGELLTLLEMDKRDRFRLQLPLSGDWFTVPPNVWIIGTMNTADRSIALLDAALRRRFGFVELMPEPAVFEASQVAGSLPLGPWLRALNRRVREHVGRDARNLQIGHAYLLKDGLPITELAHFTQVLADDIFPLLEEYCYEDYAALARILGPALVDEAAERLRVELLDPSRGPDLLVALLAMEPELATLAAPVPAEEAEQEVIEDEADEDDPLSREETAP